ncbi:hypothetical protein BROUX41_004081 [Berkeleyomyces rouxiae]|uniref:uncharacterized protein n=1 Tax=Berkeleyomyces rouxiae TaxID=2035830 RepID=UPI003B80B922
MSTLATPVRSLQAFPHQPLSLSRDMIQPSSEGRDGASISLPSLNQMLPEFYSTPSPNASDSRSPRAYLAPLTSPDYVHSPTSNKRRRASIEEDDAAERSSRVPRVYPSPITDAASAASRSPSMRASSWSATPAPVPSRSEPRAPLPPMSYPREMPASHPHPHHATPMPPHAIAAPVSHSYAISPRDPREDQYMHHAAAAAAPAPHHTHYQQRYTSVPPHHQYAPAHMAHGHSHPAAASPYGYDHYQRFEGMATADTKQRKRRGNLPKETTDKLRHWFMNHLNHPYPTENEKMELMRMTGLQMNQISNWFINARRRQLPNIMVTARNEAEARYNQTNGNKGSSVPLSDGDSNSAYGDDSHYKRTSL